MRVHRGTRAELLCGAVGLIVAATALASHATNLLINPGFEIPTDTSGNNTDSTCTGWIFYGSCERANFANHTPGGTWGILEDTSAPGGVGFGGIYQNVENISGGFPYSLSAYFYFEANYPTSGAIADLALTWYGPGTIGINAAQVGTPALTTILPGSVTTGVWTQYSINDAMGPAGATQLQVSFDFSNGSPVSGGNQSAFVDDADLEPHELLENPIWDNSSGDWNIAANWASYSVPNRVGAEAWFVNSNTSPQTVYTNTPVTLGRLWFDSPNEYEITGTGSLTLQTSNISANVEVDEGTDELDLPVTIASNTELAVSSGATLIVANPVTIDAGMSLTQTGGGTVIYQSVVTVGEGGSISFSNAASADELSVPSGARASIVGAGSVLTVNSLSNRGTLDVQKNRLLIDYAGTADPSSSVESQLRSGYAGGRWDGAGIESSSAAQGGGRYGVGWADGADGVVANLSSGQIEVEYALFFTETSTSTAW